MRYHLRAPLGIALILGVSVSVLPAPAHETSAPSLRLLASSTRVTLDRYRERVSLWGLGVWATPTGGAFELKVAKPSYDGPPLVVQRDPDSGEILRELPDDSADGWVGLRNFLRVTFRTTSGEIAAARSFPFCPNSMDRQRIDDSGPDVPTYPDSCGSPHFPFLKGMVWGIEEGWATRALSGWEVEGEGSPSLRIPRGEYRVTVRITPRHAELLEIPEDQSRVDLDVTVRNARRGSFRMSQGPIEHQAALTAAVPTVTDPDPTTLPDLAALPLWGMHVNRRKSGDFLVFAASPWNAGPAPLMVEGFRRAGEDVMDAVQYFYDRDRNVVGKAPAGTMRYHRGGGHDHWHFTNLVTFSILDANKNRVVLSKKQSFCIAPTDAVDLTVPGADYQPWSLRFSSRCGQGGSVWVRTVLQPGWADTYVQWVAGQSFNITNLPNGRYYVRVHVNPRGTLYDADPDNDIEDRRIRLGGRPGGRMVRVAPWHGVEA